MSARRCSVLAVVCTVCSLPLWAGGMVDDLRITASSEGPVITVQALLPRDGGEVTAVEVVWREVSGADPLVEVRQGVAADESHRLMLDRVLEVGMGAYLDARLRYTRTGVSTAVPALAMAGEMNAMIAAASQAFGTEGITLSSATTAQLVRFTQLDWSSVALLSSVRSGAQDKYLVIYRVLQAQRAELDRQLRADLIALADVPVWGDAPDPRTSYPIPSTCGTVFDADNFMCALDLGLDVEALPSVDAPMITMLPINTTVRAGDASRPKGGVGPRVRKRDRLQAELAAINDGLAAIEDMRQVAALAERVRDLEDALADLRVEMQERREVGHTWELPGSMDGCISVRFDGGSTLPVDQRAILDPLAQQVAAMPALRVAVYGLVGTDGRGVRLAEERAATVRAYLLGKGVQAVQVLTGVRYDERPGPVWIEVLP